MNTAAQALDVRAFNRFYTRRIGMLAPTLSGSGFTLPQARVLWELSHHAPVSAAALSKGLQLDAGYLSRLLRGLKARGLLAEQAHPSDGRQRLLRLSAAGRRAFAPLDRGSQAETEALLAPLSTPQRQALLGAMSRIQAVLEPEAAAIELRPPLPGDLGWLVERHGAIYAAEYGLDARFEALVARICADFVDRFDPAREACWIAMRGAERLGAVMLVQARSDRTGRPRPGVAQLRLLLLEPHARGLGLGKRLVHQCSGFARGAGYRRVVLWTQSALTAARAIYAAEGYRLKHSEAAHNFGQDVVSETWELAL
ncbi:bifunctional helix-turn-helix transcriptional regulator/GNAT family N-acetyltransferase [Pelomonas aquatica]|uniref:GNAT family N-acetyltransferase n=1 Tax=Pelomonas aquatica TaxID=431058 RepID=A0A9X4LGA3_9BURK|nr:bifunctional helix-turn-helix transcriptional regulator/GNAT family N-acetyltransferase [Pelomonas aquatica]MCY4755577.1 bifunctional helix-turn-helix transcriptional regulator/GNAT family N-acetyltransferase [Pelomonas aquatica]MDG0862209.1 GNAT family N-acetyltransferase [Pelomonas aquatica]